MRSHSVGTYHPDLTCTNPKCPKQQHEKTTKCASCHFATYCSKNCYHADLERHKPQCANWTQLMEEERVVIVNEKEKNGLSRLSQRVNKIGNTQNISQQSLSGTSELRSRSITK